MFSEQVYLHLKCLLRCYKCHILGVKSICKLKIKKSPSMFSLKSFHHRRIWAELSLCTNKSYGKYAHFHNLNWTGCLPGIRDGPRWTSERKSRAKTCQLSTGPWRASVTHSSRGDVTDSVQAAQVLTVDLKSVVRLFSKIQSLPPHFTYHELLWLSPDGFISL